MGGMSGYTKPSGDERLVGGPVDLDTALTRNFRAKECNFSAGGSVHALAVVPIYYNPDTLAYEYAQRPSIHIDDLTVSMGDVEKLLAESYWKLKQFAYDSDGNVEYAGFNTDGSAADGDTDWYVWKYTWSSGNCTKIQGPVEGSWTGRVALF